MTTTRAKATTRDMVRLVLQRRKYVDKPWTTATQLSEAFGYSSAQGHIEAALKAMLADGEVQRRPYQGEGRARWEYALG